MQVLHVLKWGSVFTGDRGNDADDGGCWFLDAVTGECLWMTNLGFPATSIQKHVAWHPNSDRLFLSATDKDHNVPSQLQAFDLTSKSIKIHAYEDCSINGLHMSPDGAWLSSSMHFSERYFPQEQWLQSWPSGQEQPRRVSVAQGLCTNSDKMWWDWEGQQFAFVRDRRDNEGQELCVGVAPAVEAQTSTQGRNTPVDPSPQSRRLHHLFSPDCTQQSSCLRVQAAWAPCSRFLAVSAFDPHPPAHPQDAAILILDVSKRPWVIATALSFETQFLVGRLRWSPDSTILCATGINVAWVGGEGSRDDCPQPRTLQLDSPSAYIFRFAESANSS